MNSDFVTQPIAVSNYRLQLSVPEGSAASDLVATILAREIIAEQHERMHRDITDREGHEPRLEDWHKLADELKQDLKLRYVFGGEADSLRDRALEYFKQYPDAKVEEMVRLSRPSAPEFIGGTPSNSMPRRKDNDRQKKQKRKAQRQARRSSRAR